MKDEVEISDKAILEYLKAHHASKLTNWKQEPTVSDLMHDLNQSIPTHSAQMSKIEEWLKNLNQQTDYNLIKKGRSGIAPKVIRRLAEWRYGSLASAFLNERNLFKVNAYSPKYIDSAIQAELMLNFQFNALINKVKFINDYIRTAVNEGTVKVRIGWEYETQIKEKEIPVYQYVQADPQQAQAIQQALAQLVQEQEESGTEMTDDTVSFSQYDPDFQESIKATVKYGQPVIAVNTGRTQKIKEEVAVKNRPAIKVIDNNSLIIDPTCEGDFDKARFVIYCYQTSLSELKQAGIYKNLDSIVQQGEFPVSSDGIMSMPDELFNSIGSNINKDNNFRFQDNARKRLQAFEYWGYWDIDGSGIAQGIVATIVNGKIIRLERNPFPDNKLPFVVVPYLPSRDNVYGEPDGELIKDNQQIIQALTRSVIDINARSANGQVAIPKGFLDTVNKAKFNKGEDYEYNPSNIHPAEAIYMHTANEVPQSVMALLQSNYAEAESATGVKSFQNGIDGNAYGQVVAGMSQAVTAMTQREADIIFRLSKGLEEIGNKIVAMNSIWLEEEEFVAVTTDEFIKIKRDDLAGDFYLDVSVKSNSESEGKAQQLTFLMQTMGVDLPFELKQVFLTEICRLYNLDTATNMIKNYEPKPDPFQEAMQQIELEKAKAEVQKLMDESEYYRARSEFIQTQIEQATADVDLKNLEFLEKESGLDHMRKKDLVRTQAEEQNKGKREAETIKGAYAAKIAALKAKIDGINGKNAKNGIPNPEKNALPNGLMKADGLGNHIKGDGYTTGNVT